MSNLLAVLIKDLNENRVALKSLVQKQIEAKQQKKELSTVVELANVQSEISLRRTQIRNYETDIMTIRGVLSQIPRGKENVQAAIEDESQLLDSLKSKYQELTLEQHNLKKQINTVPFENIEDLARAQSRKDINKQKINEITQSKLHRKSRYKLLSDYLHLEEAKTQS